MVSWNTISLGIAEHGWLRHNYLGNRWLRHSLGLVIWDMAVEA